MPKRRTSPATEAAKRGVRQASRSNGGGPLSDLVGHAHADLPAPIDIHRLVALDLLPRLTPPTDGGEARELGGRTSLITELSQALLSGDERALETAAGHLRRGGSSHADVVDELLAPIARYLGEAWKDDTCSFVDVTVALGQLDSTVRRMSADQRPVYGFNAAERSILLTMAPREQHTFGLTILADAFERAGWLVTVLAGAGDRDPKDVIATTHFDVLGVTVGSAHEAHKLRRWLSGLRRRARHDGLRVLIGGYHVNTNPSFVADVGADATAPDARSAVALANALLSIAAPSA